MAIGEIRELNIPAHEGYVRARGVVVVLFAFRARPRARRPVAVPSFVPDVFVRVLRRAHTGCGWIPRVGHSPGRHVVV